MTIAEDILKVKYTKFKENLLFTFRGKTFVMTFSLSITVD